jgi:hypothetical protein
MVSKPVVSSIRSKQTGQVGNSTNDGVGGANGFVDREDACEEAVVGVAGVTEVVLVGDAVTGLGMGLGVYGSCVISGKLEGSLVEDGG